MDQVAILEKGNRKTAKVKANPKGDETSATYLRGRWRPPRSYVKEVEPDGVS